jgi:lipid-A-disaccharide synthase
MPLIYILAGEASGDVLGARLIAALRAQRPSLEFAGVGGPRMADCGLPASLFPISDLSVMGIIEVLPRIRLLRRRHAEVLADIARRRPDVVVTIDSPGFMHHVLAAVASLGIPRVHYVAPQVWAWRAHRVKRYPGLWDRLLCLLPFEPAWFARHGLPATFVGHPVLESGADQGDAARFRTNHGLTPDQPVLVLMPGSRRSEAPRLLPVFGRALHLLAATQQPALRPVLPVSAAVSESVRRAAKGWPMQPIIVTSLNDKHDAYAAASVALTKSGTSTLELALAGVPMAVAYRVNPLTAAMARRMIQVPHVAMVNLLAGRALVPELLQGNCTAETLSSTMLSLLNDPGRADAQRSGFRAIMDSLRPPSGLPSEAAAQEVLDVLEQALATRTVRAAAHAASPPGAAPGSQGSHRASRSRGLWRTIPA